MATIAEFSIDRDAAERRAVSVRFHLRVFGRWLYLGVAFLLLSGVALAILPGTRSTGVSVIAFAVIYPALLGGWVLYRAGQSTPFDSGRFRFVADDVTGLHLTSDVIDQTIAWSAYKSFATDGRYLYLQASRTRAQVLPLAEPGVQALARWLRSTGRLAAG